MINNVVFENFRGFEKMELSKLRPITLISGRNNVGKSSILEGIFLFFDHVSPESFAKINQFRGIALASDSVNLWESAFYQMDTTKTMRIYLEADGIPSMLEYERDESFVPANDINVPQEMMNQIISSAKSLYTLKFCYEKKDYLENGHFIVGPMGMFRSVSTTLEHDQIDRMTFTQYINAAIINSGSLHSIVEWFGKLELEGKKQQIINILQFMEPMITDLSTIVVNGQVQLYAKMGGQLLPLRLAGDGVNKLLFILLSMIANPHSIILIDEIETGFHYSMFPKLWETIAQATYESGCQVIATTHSYECIVGAIDGVESAQRKSDFCYLRVDKIDDKNRAYWYSDDLLQTAIATDMEVR